MGIIKEPKGINFIVDPRPLTAEERKEISDVIAFYKATGKKMPKPAQVIRRRATRTKNKKKTTA